jgi:hypothetical protein
MTNMDVISKQWWSTHSIMTLGINSLDNCFAENAKI